jgi:chromosome segregation ATPase
LDATEKKVATLEAHVKEQDDEIEELKRRLRELQSQPPIAAAAPTPTPVDNSVAEAAIRERERATEEHEQRLVAREKSIRDTMAKFKEDMRASQEKHKKDNEGPIKEAQEKINSLLETIKKQNAEEESLRKELTELGTAVYH